MSWMQRLADTFVANRHRIGQPGDDPPLTPVLHLVQAAHIDVVVNAEGNFVRATVVPQSASTTIIPCTETSMGRSGTKPASHALSDGLQYVAGDFAKYGGVVTSGFDASPRQPFNDFVAGLKKWCESPYRNKRVSAVCAYVQNGELVADLIRKGILVVDPQGQLLSSWSSRDKKPDIFRVLKDQTDAVVRWHVEIPGEPSLGLHEDPAVWDSWRQFHLAEVAAKRVETVCAVTGSKRVAATMHPKKIINTSANAKLISADDKSGFTYRGRFDNADQACPVGLETTLEAHSALSWLIGRQGYKNGTQAIVAWAVSGKEIPDPNASSDALFDNYSEDATEEHPKDDSTNVAFETGDFGQAFSRKLRMKIRGYHARLGPTEDIITLGLDCATKGRMAVMFYREMKGFEFLDRLASWHETFAWFQQFAWDDHFVGAPAPRDIADAACGLIGDDSKSANRIRRATVERLLPCIIDGRPLPRDLMEASVRQVARRIGFASEKRRIGGRQTKYEAEWEKLLGIACSLFRGFHKERKYAMALEPARETRDYLYGRLFAIAEHLERRALLVVDESRDTTTARLMQRFCENPYSTWLNIKKSLQPYRSRLQTKNQQTAKFLHWINALEDDVHCKFDRDEFMATRPLSGEYLLGYHCQRRELHKRSDDRNGQSDYTNLSDASSQQGERHAPAST